MPLDTKANQAAPVLVGWLFFGVGGSYAKGILRNAEKLRDHANSAMLQDLYSELIFTRSQAVADYAKAASKRLGGKPKRDDFMDLVKKATETMDMT